MDGDDWLAARENPADAATADGRRAGLECED
jgi:hypothetical protein